MLRRRRGVRGQASSAEAAVHGHLSVVVGQCQGLLLLLLAEVGRERHLRGWQQGRGLRLGLSQGALVVGNLLEGERNIKALSIVFWAEQFLSDGQMPCKEATVA